MARGYFAVGTEITWKQYPTKRDADRARGRNIFYEKALTRTGRVWADCPHFDGCTGAHVWVIPDDKLPGENSAIAVRVTRGGPYQGSAEVCEDAAYYHEYSLKLVTSR